MVHILGHFVDAGAFWGIVATAVIGLAGIVISVILYKRAKKAGASRGQVEKLQNQVDAIAAKLGIPPPYVDGLPKAGPAVRDPFAAGLTAMEAYKWDEAIGHFEAAIPFASGSQVVALLNLIGACHFAPGRLDESQNSCEESARLAEQCGDKLGRAAALGNIGNVLLMRGDFGRARERYEEALKLSCEAGDRGGQAAARGNIGLSWLDAGDAARAIVSFEEALKIHREIGSRNGEVSQLGNIGCAYQHKGEFALALSHFQGALRASREIGDRQAEANQLGNIGSLYAEKGDLDDALRYQRESADVNRAVGSLYGEGIALGVRPKSLDKYPVLC